MMGDDLALWVKQLGAALLLSFKDETQTNRLADAQQIYDV